MGTSKILFKEKLLLFNTRMNKLIGVLSGIPEYSKARVFFKEIVLVLLDIFNEIRHSSATELFCGQIFQKKFNT